MFFSVFYPFVALDKMAFAGLFSRKTPEQMLRQNQRALNKVRVWIEAHNLMMPALIRVASAGESVATFGNVNE